MPPVDTREFKQLPIGLLDPPQLDARMDRNEEELDRLAGDIAKRGVILPLAVVRDGARYEIVDGLCRFIASRRAQLAVVPCLIYDTRDDALDGIKYAANIFRLEMTPAEEATYFQHLYYKTCGEDLDRVCDLVGQKRSYVDSRLQLVLGDEDVFEAVRHKKITLGVAAKLNEITDKGWRDWYLGHAIKTGATVALVTGWVMEWKGQQIYRDGAPQPAQSPAAPIVASDYNPLRCYVCGKVHQGRVPTTLTVDDACREAILDPLLASYRGES